MRILDPRTAGHRDHGVGYDELRDEVEAELEQALRHLNIHDMHTGRQPGYGYVSPEEAAGQMIEEAIEPYRQDLRRRLKLGLHQAAQAVGAGIIAGLRACEGTYDGDEVLCHAGEELAENYGWTVREELRKHGLELPVQEDDDEE